MPKLCGHLDAPWQRPIVGWQNDIAQFPGTIADLAAKAREGTAIVGGNFNSAIDTRPFRRLLVDGYRDAAEQAGSGRDLAFPANRSGAEGSTRGSWCRH